MDLSTEKQRPQLVEVVNNSSSPTATEVVNLPMSDNGSSVYVNVRNSPTLQAIRPQSSYFHVQLDNILLLQSDGGFFAVPLNSVLTNMTNSNLNNALASYKIAYSVLTAGVASATLHYSKMTSSGVVTSEVYNLKD